ncbi:hypothetical protein [Tenacibaculum xiamenense]|uniref:hypothetical protein n=1 Tax=Tenacibaculum xiamenense TaxID=1261553 RepID=UPI00389617ED
MRKTMLLMAVCLWIYACSSVKSTQEAINKGNYDEAIKLSVKKLVSNKFKEKNQPYVVMLQDAFIKATSRDLSKIDFLRRDSNPENLEEIFNVYNGLKRRQEKIRPLLPLKIISTGRNAVFNFNNYDEDIIAAKNDLSEYLYVRAKSVFDSRNKQDYRAAYKEFEYIDKINPNYKDVRNLMNECHQIGTDFVFVSLENKTDKVIPTRLEDDLLNFEAYHLNDFWTVYHNEMQPRLKYDYTLELLFRDIIISPEHIYEKEFVKERQIKDGFKYAVDANGNVKKDSLGNKIKVDKFITARCNFYRFTQSKSVQVVGQVRYFDNASKQLLESFPLQSEFIFEHTYATSDGDRRALEDSFINLLALRAVPFPSNEQMIYDVGKDVKQKLKSIISRNRIRN